MQKKERKKKQKNTKNTKMQKNTNNKVGKHTASPGRMSTIVRHALFFVQSLLRMNGLSNRVGKPFADLVSEALHSLRVFAPPVGAGLSL